MRHVPFFRWVATLGLVLIGCATGLFAVAVPDLPELRQVDLMVWEEQADGTCRVEWTDPFRDRWREGPYQCDPQRDPSLKARDRKAGFRYGYDSGFLLAEGPDIGNLYALGQDDEAFDGATGLVDALALGGAFATLVGVVGGIVRRLSRSGGARGRPARGVFRASGPERHTVGSLFRLGGVERRTVRRAAELKGAAELVALDYRRAVDDVRRAWAPSHRALVDEELDRIPVARLRRTAGRAFSASELTEHGVHTVRDVLDAQEWGLEHSGVARRTAGLAVDAARRIAQERSKTVVVRIDADRPEPRTTAVLAALRVLVEAGPGAKGAAERGAALAKRLDVLLADAAPAAGYWPMLRSGPERRRRAAVAVAGLRRLLDGAEREGLAERFAQASVDLLRGPDIDSAGLAAWVDFESRPAEYHALLAKHADRSLPPGE
ncbi:hypothetical protein [Streptomyces sp. NPDC018711]|uniref:hypothetical protein n=1 Tax=Streptomyces sp. NPDC018711 TaxID=3365052 RepID=UPI0037A7204A